MAFVYKVDVNDDATAKLRKVTGATQDLERQVHKTNNANLDLFQKGTVAGKVYNEQVFGVLKSFIGITAAIGAARSVMNLMNSATKEYVDMLDKNKAYTLVSDADFDRYMKASRAIENMSNATRALNEAAVNGKFANFLKDVWSGTKMIGAMALSGKSAATLINESKTREELIKKGTISDEEKKQADKDKKDREDRAKKALALSIKAGAPKMQFEKEEEDIKKRDLEWRDKLLAKTREQAEAERSAHMLVMQWKKDEQDAEKAKAQLQQDNVNNTISNSLALADMFKENNEGMFTMAKALAIAQATMSAYASISKTLELGGGFAIPLAIATGALAFAQVAQISQTQFKGGMATGGMATGGNYLVGERGPERVSLPKGSKVTPNDKINSGITINITGTGDARWVQDTLIPVIKRQMARA